MIAPKHPLIGENSKEKPSGTGIEYVKRVLPDETIHTAKDEPR